MPELPSLGYGAANLGNLYRPMDEHTAWDLLEQAWTGGIRYFDTAPHYGLGLSERRLGQFLATKPRDEYVLSTKVGRLLRPVPNPSRALDLAGNFAVPADHERVWDPTADGIRRSVEESLDRLGLDRIDIVFLHDPEKYDLHSADKVAYPALRQLRDEGVVDAVGVGSMSTEALSRATAVGGLDLLMVAGRLTLAEQPDDLLAQVRESGIAIIAAGVFNSGLLAHNDPGIASRYEYGAVPAEVLERVRAIAAVCRDFAVDLPAAALQYPLRVPSVTAVVVGGSRPSQIEQNASLMTQEIPEVFWSRLEELALIDG